MSKKGKVTSNRETNYKSKSTKRQKMIQVLIIFILIAMLIPILANIFYIFI